MYVYIYSLRSGHFPVKESTSFSCLVQCLCLPIFHFLWSQRMPSSLCSNPLISPTCKNGGSGLSFVRVFEVLACIVIQCTHCRRSSYTSEWTTYIGMVSIEFAAWPCQCLVLADKLRVLGDGRWDCETIMEPRPRVQATTWLAHSARVLTFEVSTN